VEQNMAFQLSFRGSHVFITKICPQNN